MTEVRHTATAAPTINPYFALLLGVAAVSTGAIFARLASEAPPLVIAAYRVGLASLIIVPFALLNVRDELFSLSKRDLGLALLSGLFLALHFGTWISSLKYTSVANSVVLVNTNPLWVGLLTPLITKERLKPGVVIGIFLSVCGGVIIGAGDFMHGGTALWGDALAIMGSLCAAGYLLMGRSLRRRLSLLAYICVCYASAAIFLWTLVFSLGLPITGFTSKTYSWLFAMALISQVVGHSSYNWALKWFSASLIAVSLLGEPVLGTLFAYILFHEGLTVMKLIGGALILLAIYITTVSEARKR
jgi:drug/metabolite transporter (DMT)-like permease